jgi:hypothetical protein
VPTTFHSFKVGFFDDGGGWFSTLGHEKPVDQAIQQACCEVSLGIILYDLERFLGGPDPVAVLFQVRLAGAD